ncbi:MAG: pilus assembly protein PilM, partial [Planctomycetes bacterium]|nr:pilus assembly protein PilM [Planctomycetota bacterium]
ADIVDVCPIAAYNWLKHTGEFGDQADCVALNDIGAGTTDIVIERDNQFRFTRPLNIGGNNITTAIATEFGLNFEDAERVKRQRGFAPTGDPKKDGKGGEVIGGVLQRMVAEIMRSFAYFRSQPGGTHGCPFSGSRPCVDPRRRGGPTCSSRTFQNRVQ